MCWIDHILEYYAETITTEIYMGPVCYVYCDLKRYASLSMAASLLRDIKISGWQICAFYTTKVIQNLLCCVLDWSTNRGNRLSFERLKITLHPTRLIVIRGLGVSMIV